MPTNSKLTNQFYTTKWKRRARIISVSSQLTFLLTRSMQFLRGTMTTLNNVRGFVFLSLKLRNITPPISLLSYHSEKVGLYDPFCLFRFADVS